MAERHSMDETAREYEAPAITRLGSVDQLTLDAPDESSLVLTDTVP